MLLAGVSVQSRTLSACQALRPGRHGRVVRSLVPIHLEDMKPPRPRGGGVEGIVSKRLSAPYRSGPLCDWIKVKNPDSPAMVRHQEDRR
jgi:hypothetical protein